MKTTIIVMILCLLSGVMLGVGKSTITDSYNAETAKNYTRALQIMEEIAATDTNDDFYQLRIGWLQYLLGKYNEAIKSYTKSNTIAHSLDAQTGIVNCQLALGKWDDARELADQILKSYPQNSVILGKAAYAAYMKQDYAGAASYYLSIIRITPWDMEIRGYLVNNLYLSKDTENARKHYVLLKKYYPESLIVKEYAKIFG
ncbi:MAG: tetratricopeptide repeat protein [Candidatus Cloacimonetes bacterium]|nr:tetratricopeptide repeat protein [Candidatus Cloacimonadota bacterium]MDD3235632.1 tetratricopeptide repeat protein [Candidatus Cloacimonadota bacterium]